MDTFGERIKARRKELGITQAELARRIGVTQALISQFEKGGFTGSSHVVMMAKALNVNALWLSDGKGAKELGEAAIPTDTIERFAYIYEHTSDQGRKMVDMALGMAEMEMNRLQGKVVINV